MSEGSPLWGAGNVRPTKSAPAAKLYKIITQLHPQRPILCEHLPITQLLKSHVCQSPCGNIKSNSGIGEAIDLLPTYLNALNQELGRFASYFC